MFGVARFVCQNDVCENRARLEVQKFIALLVFLDDVGPDNIRRHQVRRELDTGGPEMQRIAERLHQLGLAEPGHAFQKDMPLAENGHQDVVDQVGITDNDLRNFLMDMLEIGLERFHLAVKVCYRIAHAGKVNRFPDFRQYILKPTFLLH